MKIGVMSDTHGSLTYFEKALDVLSDCDEIYFIMVLEMIYLKGIIQKV